MMVDLEAADKIAGLVLDKETLRVVEAVDIGEQLLEGLARFEEHRVCQDDKLSDWR